MIDNPDDIDQRQPRAYQQGMSAGTKGEPYFSNPFEQDTERHLAWSRGHNVARMQISMFRHYTGDD